MSRRPQSILRALHLRCTALQVGLAYTAVRNFIQSGNPSKLSILSRALGLQLIQLTILVHVDSQTLIEPTGTTLVAAGLVDRTQTSRRALSPARVVTLLVDAALEEARTTCHNTIMQCSS